MKHAFFALALMSCAASALALGFSGEREFVVEAAGKQTRFIQSRGFLHVIEFDASERQGRPKPLSCASAPLINGAATFRGHRVAFHADHAQLDGARRSYASIMTNLAANDYQKLCPGLANAS